MSADWACRWQSNSALLPVRSRPGRSRCRCTAARARCAQQLGRDRVGAARSRRRGRSRLVVTSVSQATRRIGVRGQEGVDHGVGDPVGDLVGMAFGHGFGGEQVLALVAHGVVRPLVAWGDRRMPQLAIRHRRWSAPPPVGRCRIGRGGSRRNDIKTCLCAGAGRRRSPIPSTSHHRVEARRPARQPQRAAAPRRWRRPGGRRRDGSARCAPAPAAKSSVCSPTTWPPRSAAKPMAPVLRGAGMAVAARSPSRPPAPRRGRARPRGRGRCAVPDGASTFWRWCISTISASYCVGRQGGGHALGERQHQVHPGGEVRRVDHRDALAPPPPPRPRRRRTGRRCRAPRPCPPPPARRHARRRGAWVKSDHHVRFGRERGDVGKQPDAGRRGRPRSIPPASFTPAAATSSTSRRPMRPATPRDSDALVHGPDPASAGRSAQAPWRRDPPRIAPPAPAAARWENGAADTWPTPPVRRSCDATHSARRSPIKSLRRTA